MHFLYHLEQVHYGILECAFCETSVSRGIKCLPDFASLAAHVKAMHGEKQLDWIEGEAIVYEGLPPFAFNQIKIEKGELIMLPAPKQAKGDQGQGGRGRGGARERQEPAVPFLKVEHLTNDPVTAKVLGVRTENVGWNDIVVKLAIKGRSFFLGLKADNPNYSVLINGLGRDENKWMGEEILIGNELNEFYEKNFVTVFEAPAKARKSK
jgi:hypothetical protein